MEWTRHTQEEVDRVVKHLDTLYLTDDRISRPLTINEQVWVVNERALCKKDQAYLESRYDSRDLPWWMKDIRAGSSAHEPIDA